MKISFDFDGCLDDNFFVQMMCKMFISSGHDVFIITSRDPQLANTDVFKRAEEFGIKIQNIIMTNGTLKVHSFLENEIDLHFDNSYDEVVAINDEFVDGTNMFQKNESMPAILVNFDTEEMGYIHNFILNK
jgi:3-deoxy-D-manno-octulosonate 8-phosphate phosphatase KdsC-like HAD superfamily phosphatase